MTNVSSPRSARRLLLLAFMGLLASCVYGRDHGDGCEDSRHACQSALDCHADQFCRKGTCRDLPADAQACATSAQCGWSQSCIDGVCNQSCSRHTDCPNGGRCDEGFCVVSSTGSRDGGSALDGGSPWNRPDAGTPRTDAGTPRPDAGTPSNDGGTCSCQADAGSPRPPPQSTCHVSADCGAGNYCINALCHQGCREDSDCPDSDTCNLGVCRPRPVTTPSCFNNLDCPAENDCVDGRCRAHCLSNAQCPAPLTCHIGYCQEAQTSSGSGRVCQMSCECPSGESCVQGRCRL